MVAPRRSSRVLAVPDLHAPFMHRDTAAFLRAVLLEYPPTSVVLLGDIADQHALSRFTRNPSGLSAGHEFRAACRQLRPLYEMLPVAKVCWGNHDRRVYDRAAEAGIPAEAIKSMRAILDHPDGWEWGDRWEVDGVCYEHGENWTGKAAHEKAAVANMGPTVIGHIHAHAGIHYVANRRHLFFGMNAGCLIDHEQYAFHYARRNPVKPIVGVGLIESGVPRFVPMVMGRGGRWVGKL